MVVLYQSVANSVLPCEISPRHGIINVTSSAQSGSIDFDNLPAEKGYRMRRVYAQSKLENSLFMYELSRRLEGTGVTVNCVHPGIVRTNLGRL